MPGTTDNPFFDRDIVSIKDFTKADLESVFAATDRIRAMKPGERGELGRGRRLPLLRAQHEDEDEL